MVDNKKTHGAIFSKCSLLFRFSNTAYQSVIETISDPPTLSLLIIIYQMMYGSHSGSLSLFLFFSVELTQFQLYQAPQTNSKEQKFPSVQKQERNLSHNGT